MFQRWRLILRYLPPYRRSIVLGFSALILGNAFLVVLAPLLLREGVQRVEHGIESGRGFAMAEVVFYAAASFAAAVLGGVASYYKRDRLMKVSRRAETDLRAELFRHVLRLPRPFFDRVRTGDLMSRATADIEAARMAIGPAAMYLADAILRLASALAVMIVLSPILTAFTLVPLAAIAAALVLLAPRIHKASRAVQDELARISSRAQESFSGARVIKTFATEEHEQATMEDLSRTYLHANVDLARVRGLTSGLLTLLSGAGVAVVLYVGGRLYLADRVDIADILVFEGYLGLLLWPMMAFGWVLSLVQRGAAGLDRLAEVFDTPRESSRGERDGPIRGDIEFRGLDFSYGGTRVLHGVSFRARAGETVGIVGPTGSGKSTLVALVPRLLDPPPGTVFVDSRDVLDIPLDELRGAIAAVPQEAFLFSTTIRENVAFGRPDAGDDAVGKAMREAHFHLDVEAFPSGVDTWVGERGITLSGGQKQRAALARALATDAPILILDDALSAVDTETETHILANLREALRNRTVLIVAHRISAVREADHILYLEDGRVVESGTHGELVARGGAYARLARAQEIEAEIEAMEA